MKALGILPFARNLIDTYIDEAVTVIDATCGNGNDTLYLAKQLNGTGHIHAFDIQQTAIDNSRIKTAEYHNITFHLDGHENVLNYVQSPVRLAIFNLGYLPKGDKSIVTLPDTTILAIERIFSILETEGIIILVIYPGHAEGRIEKDAVLNYLKQFDQEKAHIYKYEFINQKNNPPFICAIEKR
ncbi:class I SAM-dependent methyltransferase [Macrococcus armenti]|uniref:tRNA (mnm(5)s(2)U34)-methyltransferase n=1 Tax=Macrococcus armenti TaxID=2875764 RepID=UPI001CCBC7DF|nr:class I SAM-dependent methyltransferase [Macrococcus armenti]UBH08002.1 class I SAM-dependent methyltransferase [Macrococcus armenti]UBH10234.1 class I SAM-dependent methyltransferase [Macrococcus armenti]UBH14722.1 class I SAM-dependent methyltransferase [Macrococcus armenti]UBH17080.1 class I SAM-dependent methyltransferase [Macrococcus armenti]UBH19346.1 class I SAM-dependent methyltransferase [Macrococcus armenti]